MDWTSIPTPLITAGAGLLGALVGSGISASTTRTTHRERLAADQALAERKFEFDCTLAEKRAAADLSIAEKKITLDRAFSTWKRKAEFAEEILATFYEARAVINWVRSPFVFVGEGSTREQEPDETEEETKALNTYYTTVERLKSKDEFFSKLYASSYRYNAYFGEAAGNPYDALLAIQRRLAVTTRMLIETYADRKVGTLRTERVAWRRIVSAYGIDDPIPVELDKIIQDVEAVCRPAILGEP